MQTLKKIREGKVEVFVYESKKISSEMKVFYNPVMRFNRNISVAAIATFQKEIGEIRICDALSATGIAGIRYAKEVEGVKEVWLNDKNPCAVELIKKNLELNGLKDCIVTQKDANELLSEHIFTVVDIDPFGTPAPFLDSAARSVFWRGFLCVTATDTAPLCGTYPQACFRKYGIRSIKTDYAKELGLRILISSIILSLARHEKAFYPVFSFYREHWFRVFGKIKRGTGKIEKLLKDFGWVMHCFTCGNRIFGEIEKQCECGKDFAICGPIYLGEFACNEFCKKLENELTERRFFEEKRLVEQVEKEQEFLFYYDLHWLGKLLRKSIPKKDKFIEALQDVGFKAELTHFCETAIKTNANFDEVKKII
jgi:tRNA (guanine26-N2/guanine27-N2)-dimethyltransferase